MTLSPVRAGAAGRRDHSIAVALFLLLALVFAPAIGLHVAVSAYGLGQAAPGPTAPEGVAAAQSGAKPSRG